MKAIVFVHPGYLLVDEIKLRAYIKSNKIYGSYKKYLENLKRLHANANGSTVYILERNNGEFDKCHEGFEPKEDSLVIAWPRGSNWKIFGGLEHRARWTETGVFSLNNLADFLLQNNINEALLAGELGPYYNHSYGCVGRVHSLFSNKIAVRGIMDCIFPTVPYRYHVSPKIRKEYRGMQKQLPGLVTEEQLELEFRKRESVLRDLYDNAVEI